jgi:ABC-type multidrug transport system fused ATPase/permease subunit
MKYLKRIKNFLTSQEQRQAFFIIILTFIMSLFDMIGVASILPFVTILTNPQLLQSNDFFKSLYDFTIFFGVNNQQDFLFTFGAFVFFLLIFSLIIKALTVYLQIRFTLMREYSIGKQLIEKYLHQPYSWFLSRNSTDLGKVILSEVGAVIGNGVYPLTELFAKGIHTVALVTLLIIIDPKLALVVSFSLSCVYGFIFYFLRSLLKKSGNERVKNNKLRFKILSDAFGATKEVKVGALEQIYINQFSDSAINFARAQSTAQVIGQLPRFILEAIAFGGIMLLILYSIMKTGDFNNALPVISLYVFAGYRLMPAIQQMYTSFTQLIYISPAVEVLSNDIKNLERYNLIEDERIMMFKKEINLKNIHYNYPLTLRTSLKDINVNIPAKSTIGFIGATGSGKTTMVDIILGLLEPQKGTLEVDDQIITKQNLRSWQRLISYVPQQIYLSDDTILSNIAFGVEPKNVNQEAVEKAAKIANLHEFIINELPKKYQTIVGERGVRLSGGERQRIGIARALYRSPQVIIFDEATSALDYQTEQEVMEAVNNLRKDITIILIAHRLNTVENCDIIFKFEKGRIIQQGTFNELVKNNKTFTDK